MKNFLFGLFLVLLILFVGAMGYLAIMAPPPPCDFGPCIK